MYLSEKFFLAVRNVLIDCKYIPVKVSPTEGAWPLHSPMLLGDIEHAKLTKTTKYILLSLGYILLQIRKVTKTGHINFDNHCTKCILLSERF